MGGTERPRWKRVIRRDFTMCGASGPAQCRECLRSHLRVFRHCLEQPKNPIASADAAPVGMWTTLFALSTYPQAGFAVLAALLPTAPIDRSCVPAEAERMGHRRRHPTTPGIALRNGMQWAAGPRPAAANAIAVPQAQPAWSTAIPQQRRAPAGSECRPPHSRPADAAPKTPPTGHPDTHAPAPSP